MKIDCIAIDDEPLALEILQKQIEKVTYLNLVQSFHSAPEALRFLSENTVDCIFLDIKMPDLNGAELSKIIQQFSLKPEIIFVTAYSSYAVKEYLLQSIGFLLKPFSFEDFIEVTEKVKDAYVLKMKSLKANEDPFFLRIDARQVKLYPNKISYVESMGDYVKIFLEDQRSPLIPLITLKKIKTILPKSSFLQINRSQIVNFHKISSYGTSNLSIEENQFNVSHSFREDFEWAKRVFL